jgi:ubiquinone/menaquinone biosynthesis C-methylase UbiE
MMKSLREYLFEATEAGERIVPGELSRNVMADHLIRYMFCRQFVGDKTVLDDGCGCGYGSAYLAENGARMVIGIDKSRSAIEYARSHYDRRNLEFRVMDGARLRFGDNVFDVVISLEVIEHTNDYVQFLDEIVRMLKPGGLLVMSTPHGKGSHSSCAFHRREFCANELRELLESRFNHVKILGKRVTNPRFLVEANRMQSSYRVRLGTRIPATVRRLTPCRVKDLFLGRNPVVLSVDDFEISERCVEDASNLIAVCTNAKGGGGKPEKWSV